MTKELLTPDYIFEASWEVCNKVGGIYTVLSTRANTLQTKFRDRLFFIGPDFWQGKENPLFIESDNLCAAWKKHAALKDNLSVRVGRWNIPGDPIVILVDFQPFFAEKNEIYTEMWNRYQVDSLHGYGDYDEASMFAFATGKVIESFYRYNLTETDKVDRHGRPLSSVCRSRDRDYLHHPCHVHRPLHSWQQQAALRLSFRLQRRPDGGGAEHAVQTFH